MSLRLLLLLAATIGACAVGPSIPVHISPADAHLRYTGRFDFSQPERPVLDWSGTTIEAAFTGTSIAVRLADGQNDYSVYLDGALHEVLRTTAEDTLYTLATSLPDTVHTLKLVRRTEADFGPATFLGLVLDPGARLVALPPAPARRIAYIGDSITTGYGNLGDSPACPFSRETENVEESYAGQVARRFDAAYEVVAYHGKGVVRNYGEQTPVSARPFPAYYRQATAHGDARWDFQRWIPDAVVVNLGTNDVSTMPHPSRAQFVAGYLNLLREIRAAYPDAALFAVAGPLMKAPAEAWIREAVEEAARQGDRNAHLVIIPDTLTRPDDLGCHGHPNVAGHAKIAASLAEVMAGVLGW